MFLDRPAAAMDVYSVPQSRVAHCPHGQAEETVFDNEAPFRPVDCGALSCLMGLADFEIQCQTAPGRIETSSH